MARTRLRELIHRTGPFASVYFDGSHDAEDADEQLELRYRTIREKLTAAGASERTIGALGIALFTGLPVPGRSGRALVADGDTVLLDHPLPTPPEHDTVRVSPLPYLLPLIEQRGPLVPHVLAVVNPVGAQLRTVNRHGDAVNRVVSADVPSAGPPSGARPRPGIRRRDRDTLRHTVDAVVRELREQADHVRAEILALAGEPTVLAAVRTALEAPAAPPDPDADSPGADAPAARPIRIVELSGGATGSRADRALLHEQVTKIVSETAGIQYRALLRHYRAEAELATGAAIGGLRETAAALRENRVDYLLIDPAALGDRTVLVGPAHTDVATAAHELIGPTGPRRADEALPVAALAGGSEIVTVTGHITLPEGIGALLRPH
ncbi:baeRF2 domain-containing protein [Nocardia jejuensis]|uniref:baeRF2 domain-containing protein n=1 Tax=Nocardia jejuensis TaxID=328049 RepID=UPI00082D0951|nr:hypothetical protein [Nocardia jejuensis]